MRLLGGLRTKGEQPAPPQGVAGAAKAQGTNVIRATDLTKTYAADGVEVRALQGVSLDVDAGSFIAFVGPSGSGKTTLLNLLGCLDKPTRGRLEVAGTDVTRLDRRHAAAFRGAHIGFVFQSFNLVPGLTTFENVEYPLVMVQDRSAGQPAAPPGARAPGRRGDGRPAGQAPRAALGRSEATRGHRSRARHAPSSPSSCGRTR